MAGAVLVRCLGAIAAAAASVNGQPVQWVAAGSATRHSTIQASALDFDDSTGAPLLAYGYLNSSSGATSISFLRFNGSVSNGTGNWSIIASHTPEFAQPYDDFAFRARKGVLYLGLRIDEAYNISSVLRGEGGWDGFDGCYAFGGWVWDFDIDVSSTSADSVAPHSAFTSASSSTGTESTWRLAGSGDGNLRLVTSPDNLTLAYATYNASGWDSYPAADTWGAYDSITPAINGSGIDNVIAVGQPNPERSVMYFAYHQQDAGVGTGSVSVGMVPLGDYQGYTLLTTAPFPGFLAAFSYAQWGSVTEASYGLMCVALQNPSATGTGTTLTVQCQQDGGSTSNPAWFDLGIGLDSVTNDTSSSLTTLSVFPLNTTTMVVAVSAVDGVYPSLIATSYSYCQPGAAAGDAPLCYCPSNPGGPGRLFVSVGGVVADSAINNMQLKAPAYWQGGGADGPMARTAVLAVSTGYGNRTNGDAITVYAMQISASDSDGAR